MGSYLDVTCPYCGAAPGRPCQNPFHGPRDPHWARIYLWDPIKAKEFYNR